MWQLFYTIISHLLSLSEAASELISPAQPIIALVGDDVILPCHLEPEASVTSDAVMWTKPGLDPKYIYCHQNGHQRCLSQHPSYYMRTALFVDQLIKGNISLKIFRVTLFDAGEYFCILESMQKSATIHLTMAAASTPILNIAEIDPNSGGVVLQCNSTGWYPEPEVFWLDGEGNLLSAGPPETVRGPDDLYTVSSRVTVEKRHSNSFTCRVTQKKTNQTRETTIQVPAELCIVPSSLLFWITIILSLIILVIFILKLKKYITKKRNQQRPSSTQRLRQSPPPPMARATEEPQSSPPMPQQQTPDSCSIATDTTDDLPSDGSCLSDQEVSENLLEGPESRRSNSVSSQ